MKRAFLLALLAFLLAVGYYAAEYFKPYRREIDASINRKVKSK